MKTILLIAVLFPLVATAQNGNSNYVQFYLNRVKYTKADDMGFNYGYDTIGVAVNNVQKIDVKRSYRGKMKSNYNVLLNETGSVTEVNRKDYSTFYSYSEGNLTQVKTTGKKSINTVYAYNGSDIKLKESYSKGKLTSRLLVDYNSENDVELSMLQNGRKLKNTYVMHYMYDDDKVVNQKFLKNDDLLKEWNFKCKPEGEEASSKVLTNVCKYFEESNDGSFIEFVRRIENKKVRLYKYYYDADSTNYRVEMFKNDSILMMKTDISKQERHQTNYTEKGKISFVYLTKFDNDHRPIETVYAKKGKIEKGSKTVTVYNEDGTINTKQYSYNGKMNSKYTYVYTKYS